jgi:hypothetical protein
MGICSSVTNSLADPVTQSPRNFTSASAEKHDPRAGSVPADSDGVDGEIVVDAADRPTG